jgi:hypothetical protein
MRSEGSRITAGVLGLFVLAVAVFFSDVILGDRVLLTADPAAYQPWRTHSAAGSAPSRSYRTDSILTYLPRQTELARSVAAGRLPLWNPYILGGAPFFADPQSRVLYPVTLALTPVEADKAMGYDVALHVLLALTGMYLFLRRISCGAPDAILGAFAYGFSSFFFTRMGHPTFIASAAWIPFLFYGFERARSGGRGGAVLVAALFALGYLSGFPQVFLFGVLAVVVYGLYLSLDCGRPPEGEGPPAGSPGRRARLAGTARVLGVAGGLAILVVGVHLVPFVEYLRNSVGLGISLDAMKQACLWKPVMLLRTVLPNFFGNPVEGTNWVPLVERGVHPYNVGFMVYCGVGTLVLAAGGLAFAPASARLRALLLILAGAVAVGTSGLALGLASRALPLLRYSQIDRISVVACFALAALGAKSLALFRSCEDGRLRRRFVIAVGIAAAAVIVGSVALLARTDRVVTGLAGGSPAASAVQRLPAEGAATLRQWAGAGPGTAPGSVPGPWLEYERDQVAVGLAFALASLALVVWIGALGRRKLRRLAVGMLVGSVLLDLGLVARSYYVSQARPAIYETAGIKALRGMAGDRGPWRVAGEGPSSAILPPNTNLIFGLQSLAGRSTIMPRAHAYLLGAGLEMGALEAGEEVPTVRAGSALAAFMGTKYVLAAARRPDTDRLKLVYDGDLVIYEDAAAVAKAIVVDRSVGQGSYGRSGGWGADGSEGRAGAGLLRLARIVPAISAAICGRAEIVDYRPEEVAIEVTADRDCYLLVQDSYYPGWKVSVDGLARPVLMTDLGTRAVEVPAGRHSVVMKFAPTSLKFGLVASSVGIILGVIYATRRKKPAVVR